MTARSLHIGLNYVNPDAYDGWDGALSGCINDATDFRDLASGKGFAATLLTDSQATSHEILRQLSQAARVSRSGDIFLITYSGHGGQVNDATGDEQDQLDETWVLWDRQVIDDELYAIWRQFDAGVRIVVISDSCHSGTVARVALYKQLNDTVRSANTPVLNGVTRAMPGHLARQIAQRDRAMYDTVQFISGRSSRDAVNASLILISGCQDSQLSYDGDDNGLFSGTLLRIWNNGAFTGSYRSLHRSIVEQMPPYQTPNFFTVGTHNPAFEQQPPFTTSSPDAGTPVVTPPVDVVPPDVPGVRPDLSLGDSGEHVAQLQGLLKQHGYSLVADGFFGRVTRDAVISFQRQQGLAASGVVDAATWQALNQAQPGGGAGIGDAPPPVDPGGQYPVLRRGQRGDAVREMQELLVVQGYHLTPDGIFGPQTESHVKSFQRSHGLVADGIVGRQTWVALQYNRQLLASGANWARDSMNGARTR